MRPVLLFLLAAAVPVSAALLEGLPGEEVSGAPAYAGPPPREQIAASADSAGGVNWLAPSVQEQIARDPTLLPIGKGSLFVPTYSEPRREPEISVLDASGKLVATGQSGHRIILDSGAYEVRFGSGAGGRRLSMPVRVREGQTEVLPPTWGGLLVETLTETGEYVDGQYDLVRMDRWIAYGRGQGYKEERLQDIEVWILPPGLYRLSKVGEGYNSLRNYVTVQINPGELHSVELVFDPATGSLIAGGTKSLNTHAHAGRHWTYGLRAGGNLALTRTVNQADLTEQSTLFSSDLRLRARYDQPSVFGVNEIFLQNSFLKDEDQPLSVTADFVQVRSTWVRRWNDWLGPYVRGQLSTHLFPSKLRLDTAYVIEGADTATVPTGGTFEEQPSFFPLSLAEGAGANIEWLSRYELELSTQVGLAARQDVSDGDYLPRTSNTFERSRTVKTIGAEGVLNARLRISSAFTLDLLAEGFAENANLGNFLLEDLEADFRFFVARNVEIGYLFTMSEQPAGVANRYPRSHSLSLRLNFNY